MSLDHELESAVVRSVEQLKQPKTVAKRLLSWLEEASRRELSKEDEASRLSDIYSALVSEGEERTR